MYSASFYALFANLFFSVASISYASHSRKYGSLWVNSFKSFISLVFITFAFIYYGFYNVNLDSIIMLYMLSGLIGLAIGDYFLVIGFEKIGPARTILLFGVQPIIFLAIDSFVFHLQLSMMTYLGVGLMLTSLLLVFFERKKDIYSWSLYGFGCGFIGVLLDFSGVLITKWAMNNGDHHLVEVYFWRMLGAVIGLFVFHSALKQPVLKFKITETLFSKSIFIMACLSGTLVSLLFYLKAIEVGPLSAVAAVAVTGPLFAGLFEWLVFKKPMTKQFILALSFFGFGFYLLS